MTAPDMFLCDEDNAVLEAIRKRLADPLRIEVAYTRGRP